MRSKKLLISALLFISCIIIIFIITDFNKTEPVIKPCVVEKNSSFNNGTDIESFEYTFLNLNDNYEIEVILEFYENGELKKRVSKSKEYENIGESYLVDIGLYVNKDHIKDKNTLVLGLKNGTYIGYYSFENVNAKYTGKSILLTKELYPELNKEQAVLTYLENPINEKDRAEINNYQYAYLLKLKYNKLTK